MGHIQNDLHKTEMCVIWPWIGEGSSRWAARRKNYIAAAAAGGGGLALETGTIARRRRHARRGPAESAPSPVAAGCTTGTSFSVLVLGLG